MENMKILLQVFLALLILSACSHETQKKESGREIQFPPREDTALDRAIVPKPFIKNITDSSVVFGVEATRQADVEGEYLPSSEEFRIEIISQKGRLEWSSNYNKNFMQVISEVKPLKAGETHAYSIEWNGERNGGGKLAPGLYTIRAIIPARPKAYVTIFKFEWKNHNE